MRRIIVAALAGLMSLLLSGIALAQTGSDFGPPEGPQVGGTSGSIGGAEGSAFTGSEVAGLIVAALLLVALGATALVLARRRTSTSRAGA